MAYPQVWIEDDAYVNGAFLLSRGWLPYRDFPLPHFPLLEAIAAAVFRVSPASIRTAEAMSATAALAASVLIFSIASSAGPLCAWTSAIVFAGSSLLFRYHVFEREVFVVVPVLIAIYAATSRRGAPGTAGVALGAAMLIKLTAFAALVGLTAELIVERRRREAGIIAAVAIGIVAAAALLMSGGFGKDFVVQVFVFRAVHASFPSLGVKLQEMRLTLDVAFALGAAGTALLLWDAARKRRGEQALRFVPYQIASGFLFLVLLNPTYWAHTGIELLPWLACAAGYLVARVARPDQRAGRSAALALAAVAAFLLIAVSPINNLNSFPPDEGRRPVPYGFGYRDRAELERVASVIRARTSATDAVATPEIIAFAANRREVVPYAELAGEMDELRQQVDRDGYLAVLTGSRFRDLTFWDAVDASRELISPRIAQAVASSKVGAVVNYSEDDLFPVRLVQVPQGLLESNRYDLALLTSHYEVWTVRPRP